VDEERSSWPGRVGLLLAVIIATGASLWFLPDVIRQHAAELHARDYVPFAETMGAHLAVIIAIAFAVLYVLFLRGWGLERPLVYLFVIFFIAADVDAGIVYATISAGHEQSFQYGQAVADVRTVIDHYTASTDSEETLQARAANDSRIIAGISTNEAAQLNRVRAAYQMQISTLILDGSLKPQGLAAHGGLKKAREHIAQARALITKSRDEEEKVFADTRSMVSHAQIDESVRTRTVAAFNHSLQQREALSTKVWGYEDAILAEADLMVQDLANSQSDWRAQGDAILFASRHDLSAYRAHIAKIREISQTERLLVAQSGDTVVTTVQYTN
jgi:hypothetical protein